MTPANEDSLDDIAASPSSMQLGGSHILVTGAGRGLGQSIALSAVRCGAKVTILARTAEQLAHTQRLSRQLGQECETTIADLSDHEALDRVVDEAWARQPLSGVVHAAGTQLRKPAIDVTAEDWRRVQSVNMDAPFFLSTAIARRQITAHLRGSHVFVGSLNSTIGLARIAPYAASKTALLGMARVMSTEWAARGLRANVIGPGYFRTELTKDLLADPANEQRVLSRIPAGDFGRPRDVGALAVFLLSEASSYITGQLLNVDGGWLAS